MITLGINAVFHDGAAALVVDGQVVAAAEDERFTRIKHGKRPLPFTTWELPFHAIDACLGQAGMTLADVDQFAYSFDPLLLPGGQVLIKSDQFTLPLAPSAHFRATATRSPWDPLFLAYVINAPRHLADGAPHHLRARLQGLTPDEVTQRWRYVAHHTAHEASAYLASPFDDTAVLTLDGRGECASTTLGVFRDGAYQRLKQIDIPHSLGLLYEAVTEYLGFLRSSDEYKVMALASYGKPTYVQEFRDIVRTDGAGGYRVEPPRLARRFGPPRDKESPLTDHHADIAHSLQHVLQETVLSLAAWLRDASHSRHLVMAGGVALNCVLNAHLAQSGLFDDIWVQPAAGDAGTALGAALWLDRKTAPAPRPRWVMDHAYLGPAYGDGEIETLLRRAKMAYQRVPDVAGAVADRLAANQLVGWFQGRMEFGPRALGARSILASPMDPDMQARLNALKDREDFRPVAPAVMEEHAGDWFVPHGENDIVGPFMLFVHDVRPDRADRIPAVRHTDGTARVQTVRRDQHPLYYDLLDAFRQRTGVPVLVNTSFNTRGAPIVCSPRDAIEAFWTSPLDVLALGPFLVEKRA